MFLRVNRRKGWAGRTFSVSWGQQTRAGKSGAHLLDSLAVLLFSIACDHLGLLALLALVVHVFLQLRPRVLQSVARRVLIPGFFGPQSIRKFPGPELIQGTKN